MFEPSSSVCSIAKKNLDEYNIIINNLAVGNKDGTSKFYEYGPSEISSVHKNDDKEEKKPISVPIATIDNYCYSNNIDKIDFLKIDTEGHDLIVLKSINLERIYVKFIKIEHKHLDKNKIKNYLEKYNYLVYIENDDIYAIK